MAFCANCGSEIEAGSAFCGSCGAAAPAETAAPAEVAAPTVMTPPPAAPPTPPPPGPLAPPHRDATRPASHRGTTGLRAAGRPHALPGLFPAFRGRGRGQDSPHRHHRRPGHRHRRGLLLLGFVVGPKWFVSEGDDTAAVEKVVQDFYAAMQKGDARAMLALVSPDALKELDDYAEEYGYDDGEELLQEYLDGIFPEGDLKITGLKLKSNIKGNTATVDVVGGTATYTDYYGDEVKESYDDEGEVFDGEGFDLEKINGKWYLQLELD